MGTNQKLRLTGWMGGTTGLRVDAESRRRVLLPLKPTLQGVHIELPGHPARPFCHVSSTFWTTCPEFRSAEIGRWMAHRDDKPWPHGNPPKVPGGACNVGRQDGHDPDPGLTAPRKVADDPHSGCLSPEALWLTETMATMRVHVDPQAHEIPNVQVSSGQIWLLEAKGREAG